MTALIERAVEVRYRHRVYFTEDVFSADNPLLRDLLADGPPERAHKLLVTLDATLAAAQPGLARRLENYLSPCAGKLDLVCSPLLIEGGERAKNSLVHVTTIHAAIQRHQLCRHSFVMAVGGGAHLDVAGFAAATAHRGLRHVRLPSTTLAQADSGVGVKNGVNAFGKKNFLGAFAPPFAVINDFRLLDSLPPRERRAGYAEAVKVALIRSADFFAALERDAPRLARFEPEALRALIYRCAQLHVEHIATSGDPFEFGSARPLDFGHWAAHKLETLSAYRVGHGQAVAVGVALDTVYSRLRGLLDATSAARILGLLEALGLELYVDDLCRVDSSGRLAVLDGLDEFRQHLGGELTVPLLEGIGRAVEVHELDAITVEAAVRELSERGRHGPPASA